MKPLFVNALAIAATLAVVCVSSPVQAAGVFTAHPTTPTFGSGQSSDVGLGDLDGDGDLDAVISNVATEAETVWLNDGSGNFSAHPVVPSFGAGDSQAVAVADLDGDGDADAVVGNDANQAETVWLNDGTGAFSSHPTTPSFGAGSSFDVALGDLDNDGDADAVVANSASQAETVWLNDGSGNFSPHPGTPSFGAGSSIDVTLGDLDGDNDLDAVVANTSGAAETVWENDGTGGFSAHPSTPSFGSGSSTGVALADLEADGDLDAVVVNLGAAATVWENDGAGAFSAHPTTPSFGSSNATGLDVADIDGDLDLDVVIANTGGQDKTVWLNDGSGNLSAHPTAPVFGPEISSDVELGDIDADGDADAVVSNIGAESVWLNDTEATTTTSTTTTSTTTSTTLPPSCPETPEPACTMAARSSLQLKNSDEAGKDQLKWKWSSGTVAYDDLGDPATASEYALCIYDGVSGLPALVGAIVVEPSVLWTTKAGVQWKYKDPEGTQDGVTGLSLKASSEGKAKAQLKAKGLSLTLPIPIGGGEYFDQNPSVVVQLLKHDGPGASLCLTSDFGPDVTSTNEETTFKAAVK